MEMFFIFTRLSIGRRPMMIKTQVIKEGSKPIAVILDYKEYKRLKDIEEEINDYKDAVEIKKKNKKWYTHNEVKKEIGLD